MLPAVLQFGFLMVPAAELQQITPTATAAAAAAIPSSSHLSSSNRPSSAAYGHAAGVIKESQSTEAAAAATDADQSGLSIPSVMHQIVIPVWQQKQQQAAAAQGALALEQVADRSDIISEGHGLSYLELAEEGDAASDRSHPTTPVAAAAAAGGADAAVSAVVLERVLAQLEHVGLLQLYTAMRDLFPPGGLGLPGWHTCCLLIVHNVVAWFRSQV